MMKYLFTPILLLTASLASAQTAILVGDPNALVQTKGTLVFDPAEGAATIPAHGWYNVRIVARTQYDDGRIMDLQAWMPFWSNLDPNAPITPPAENKIMLAAVTTLTNELDPPMFNPALFGQHLAEFRTQIPVYNQLTSAYTQAAFGYNYQCCLPDGVYEVRINPDLHMGIPGTLLPGTILDGQPLTPGGPPRPLGSGNLDLIDPAFIATVPPKMSNPVGDHTVAINWIETIPPNFVDKWGTTDEPAGLSLEAWLNFNIHLNPVPPPASGVPTFTIHDNPWGVNEVAQNACPAIDFQGHTSTAAGPPQPNDPPDTLVHGLSHTHVNPTFCPYIETKAGDKITIPFALKLFHTSGRIISAWAEIMGNNGAIVLPNFTVGTVVAPPPPPPPPPPAPMWHLIQPQFFRLNDAVKICDVDGKCLILGNIQ